MKTLLIIRHAKSDWTAGILNDHDRTLNQRGHADAPVMAKRVLQKGTAIDAFISSTAVRAFTTAAYFAEAYKTKETDIIVLPKLYHATPQTFVNVITQIDDAYKSVALFSHNPGVTNFVNMLTSVQIDNMPTCAVFAIEINNNTWKGFERASKKFLFFDYPKNNAT